MGLLLFLAGFLGSCPSPAGVFYIQPLGNGISSTQDDAVCAALRAVYGAEVVVLSATDLPQAAYYAPRKRYRADKLLDHLAANRPPGAESILGLTSVDISTTRNGHNDWGVVGLGSETARVCVISSFRCRRGVDEEHAVIRLAKAAVHEIGHTLGLPHCPEPTCLMKDLNGSVTTIDKTEILCTDCRSALLAAAKPVAAHPAFQWTKR